MTQTPPAPELPLVSESAEANPYLRTLARRVLVFDGAMGTTLQRAHLSAADYGGCAFEGCTEHLVLTRPDRVSAVHHAFLEAGSDVVETCTFQGNLPRLAEWGLGAIARRLNVAAARLARSACDAWSTVDRPRFAAGSMGPTGLLPSQSAEVRFEELADIYRAQAGALLDGGVDLLLLETGHDLLELKAALDGMRRLFCERGGRIPIQAQVTLDASGRMLLGADAATALTALESLGVDVIGLNCSTGPDAMRAPAAWLARESYLPIAVLPNAGVPTIGRDGDAHYPLDPDAFARQLLPFVEEDGVRLVGGCCGTGPEHIRALVRALRASTCTGRPFPTGTTPGSARGSRNARVASAFAAMSLRPSPGPLIVGERLNALGSRRMKDALLAGDDGAVVELAREQREAGAEVLDLCVAGADGGDEAGTLARLAAKLSGSVDVALMIDSTDPVAVARALERIPGRAIVNSVSLEGGRVQLDTLARVVRRRGAALVVQATDPEGPARTVDRKLAVARAAYEILVGEHALRPDDLLFDPLTFTLATGDPEWADSARATLDAIRQLRRELPGVLTVLGVSNVSHGLPIEARRTLNAVFLHRCVEAGLNLALVNPAQVRSWPELDPTLRALADDLVFNRRGDALERLVEAATARRPTRVQAPPSTAVLEPSPDARVRERIVYRRADGLEQALDAAGARGAPLRVIAEVLLPAMQEVGARFAAGELILPFVLQSAELMKRAVTYVERFMARTAPSRGRVVLATVYGDVHEIGKSLVAALLANSGYTVFDLGKQVPVATIADKAVELKADAVGLSALLVSTAKQMAACVVEFERRGLAVPILLGGAALDRSFAARAMLVDSERPYAGGVFYCRDAFEGLRMLERLGDRSSRQACLDEARRLALDARTVSVPTRTASAMPVEVARSCEVAASRRSTPPFWGSRVVSPPIDELLAGVHRERLFRSRWTARCGNGDAARELDSALARLVAPEALPRWLQPEAVYGYFPCAARGDELTVYEAEACSRDDHVPLATLRFPRQASGERRCLTDYFVRGTDGDLDVIALQVVTLGRAADEHLRALQAAGEVSEAFYTHGLAAELTEVFAEWMHRRIRDELRLAPDQGRRYAWGYGPCPDLRQQATVLRLLPEAESALGIHLSAGQQLVPEMSTAALIVHHVDATYFACEPPSQASDPRKAQVGVAG